METATSTPQTAPATAKAKKKAGAPRPRAKAAEAKGPASDGKDSKAKDPKAGETKAGETTPQAVLDDTATIRMRCGGGVATGLFVLFRCVPAKDEGKNKSLLDVVSNALGAERPAGEPEAEKPDVRAKYEHAFTPAFVDDEGFLQPLLPGSNPWFEIYRAEEAKRKAAQRRKKVALPVNPHAIKLSEGTEFDLVLLRHPQPAVARALARFLNTGEDPSGYGFSSWPIQKIRRKVEADTSKGKQLYVELPTTSDAYVPRGHARYGGWLLYYEMPHAHLPSVQSAVRALVTDLGKLRYVVGTKPPYGPNKETVFDLAVKASLHQFQLDAAKGKAFRVESRADAHDEDVSNSSPHRAAKKASWGYLCGSDVEVAPLLASGRVAPGVADGRTVDAIRKWLDQDLRKAGHILIEMPAVELGAEAKSWNEWGRPELVFAVEMWRELVTSLGCPYGISFGHTFRNLDEPGGVGKSATSIHKTGMAVDLALVGSSGDKNVYDYSRPCTHWPIRYEADWFPDTRGAYAKAYKAQEQAQARRQSAEAKLKEIAERRARAEAELKEATTALDEANLSGDRAAIRRAQGAVTRKTNAVNAFDDKKSAGYRRELERKVEAANKAEEQAKAQIELGKAQNEVSKAHWRLRWRLYGHSTLDLFGTSSEGAQALVRAALGAPQPGSSGEHEITRRLRARLLACFPTNTIKARYYVARWTARMEQIASDLCALTGDELRAKYFRRTVHQWNYNLYEADGGTTGDEIFPEHDVDRSIDYLNAARENVTKSVPRGARSFVNLTALGFLVGLRRINANKAGFRDPETDIHLTPKQKPAPTQKLVMEHKTFAVLAGLCNRISRPESAHQDDPIVVEGQGRTVERRPAEVDYPFMEAWAAATAEPTKPFGRPPRAATELAFRLSPTEETKQKLEQLLGKFDDKRFERVYVGEVLDAPSLPTIATGAEWKAAIAAEVDALIARKKADDDADAAAEQAEAAPRGADDRPPPRRGRAPKKKPRKAKPKRTYDWTLVLRPIFDVSETSLDGTPFEIPLTFLFADKVELPTPGIGRALEWWHFETEYANNVPWGRMLEDIGHSRAILAAPNVPPSSDPDDDMAGYGCGFDSDDLDVCKGGARFDTEHPENQRSGAQLPGG